MDRARLMTPRTLTNTSLKKGDDDGDVSTQDLGGGLDLKATRDEDYLPSVSGDPARSNLSALQVDTPQHGYRTYKRRWFGVVGLTVLNIVAAMNWVLFTTISLQIALYFKISLTKVNWLSNIVCCMYLMVSWIVPPLIERWSIRVVAYLCGFFLLLGAWLRYAAVAVTFDRGAYSSDGPDYVPGAYALLFLGSVCIGIGQCLVQIVGPAFSETWFSPRGRTSITALFAVANPFGGAIADIMAPSIVYLEGNAGDLPITLIFIMAITTSAASAFAFLVLPRPPTPPSFTSAIQRESIIDACRVLVGWKPRASYATHHTTREDMGRQRGYLDLRSRIDFGILCLMFATLVGFFDAYSTLINQIYQPHGYSSDATGFFGAAAILSGIVAAAVSSPIFDRYLTRHFAIAAKILTPIIGVTYLGYIWAVRANDYGGIYFLNVVQGVCSFILLPVALELGVEVTSTVMTPASSSAILYLAANGISVVFILIMNALRAGSDATPPLNMKRALIFQGVVASLVSLSVFGLRGEQGRRRRDEEALKARGAAEIPT